MSSLDWVYGLSIIQKLIERQAMDSYSSRNLIDEFRAENASCISDQFQPPRSFTAHCSMLNERHTALFTALRINHCDESMRDINNESSMNKVMHISPSSFLFLGSTQFPALVKLGYLILG